MQRWVVQDRYGNEIYMTQERWQHIISKHRELVGHLDDLLNTLKQGRRKQERRDPQRYRYHFPCNTLLYDNNRVTVVVVFDHRLLSDGTQIRNNFVTTAWGEYAP